MIMSSEIGYSGIGSTWGVDHSRTGQGMPVYQV